MPMNSVNLKIPKLYKTWGFHGSDYEDCSLLGCYAMWLCKKCVSSAAYIGCYLLLTLFLVHWFLSPWWWRHYIPLKRRFLQETHGITFHKTAFFIPKLSVEGKMWDPNMQHLRTMNCSFFMHTKSIQKETVWHKLTVNTINKNRHDNRDCVSGFVGKLHSTFEAMLTCIQLGKLN
jgi:hypothetical protein